MLLLLPLRLFLCDDIAVGVVDVVVDAMMLLVAIVAIVVVVYG